MENISHFFLDIVDKLGYGGVFVVMLLGNIGVPVGTELVMPAAGALAASRHMMSWQGAALAGTVGEILGGGVLYGIGYAGGRPFVMRYGKFLKLDESKLDAFHGFFERHGNVVVFVCRFIPFIRGISALPAGVSRMQKRFFFTYTALGSAIFCFGLAYLGSLVGGHFDAISPQIHKGSTVLIAVVLFAVAAFVVFRLARKSEPAK